MAKRTETQLVISAKDLGSKKLKDLGAAFRQLRQEQRETAAVADRTKVKQGELQATLTGLSRVLNELQARGSKLDYLKKLGQDSASSKTRIEALKAALAKLTSETDAAGKKTDAYKEKKSKLTKDLAAEERRLKSLSESYIKTSNAIEALGLNSQQAQQQLARLTAVTSRAATQTEAAIARLPREQRLYRDELEKTAAAERARIESQKNSAAEAQRRIAAETAAYERQQAAVRALAAEQARLAQRRNDVRVAFARDSLGRERSIQSGFGAFSQRATQIGATAALGQAQVAQRNAEVAAVKRQAEVEANYQRVMARRPGVLGRAATAMRGLAAQQERNNKATRSGVDAQRTALSFSQRLRGQILSLGAAYFGVFGAISQGQKALDVSNQRIALNARLLVANGDNASAAADDYKFLRDEADRLGFSLTELGTNYSKLAIAGRAAGLSTDQVREIFSNFAEVARVNNAGVEETERVFKALEQILSKGKVQAEELRGQLGDVLPGAYSAFARSLGVNGQALDDLLKKGQVSSNALLGFSREYAKSVSGQLEPATKTLRAELGRLNTAYEDFLVTVGDQSLAPALREVAANLITFFKSTDGKEFGADLADALRLIGRVVIELAKNLGEVITFVKLFIAVWAAFKVKALVASFAALAGQIAAVGATAGATTGVLAGLRTALLAVQAAAGPVGLLLAALSGAMVFLILNSNELSTEQDRLAKQIDVSANAMKAATDAANDLTAKQDALADAELRVADAEKKSAEAKAAVAKNGTAAAKAALDQAKAAEENAKKVRDQAKANAQLAEQIAENARLEAEIQLKASQNRLKEIRERLKVAQATVIEARAKAELLRQQSGPLGEPGERAARAGQGIAADGIVRRAEENFDRLRALEAEQAKALADLIAGSVSDTSKPTATLDPAALTGGDEDNKAAEKAAEDRKRLAKETADAINEIYRSGLQQQTEDEATALEAKRKLIIDDYRKQYAEIDALIQRNRESGNSAGAATLEAARKELQAQEQTALKRLEIESKRAALLKQIEESERRVQSIIDARNAAVEAIERDRERGQLTNEQAAAKTYQVQLDYQARIKAALLEYAALLTPENIGLLEPSQVEELRQKLIDLGIEASNFLNPVQVKAQELKETLAGGLADSLTALGVGIANAIKGMGSFKDAIKGAWDTFRSFIADFLVEIGRAILKALILKAIVDATKNSESGFGRLLGDVAGAMLGAGSAHIGGIVGTQAKNRSLSPAIFAAAQRYHTGGVVGLGPDEVPIVAKRGEEVLTENDPRHRGNGGMAGQQIKIVNAIDSASVVQEGLRGDAGTRAILNVVRANKAAFKAAIA